jgi:CDP-diacylglycerol pyrophosphatase
MKRSDVLLLVGMILVVAGAALLIYGIVSYNSVRASVGNALGKLITGRSAGENQAVIEMIAGGAGVVLGAGFILFRGRNGGRASRGGRPSRGRR